MIQIYNSKSTIITLAFLLGLAVQSYAKADSTTEANSSVTTTEDGLTDDSEEPLSGDYSLEDQLADLLMDHQDIRYECLQAKLALEDAEKEGDKADSTLQSDYDECMATLKQINQDIKELADQVYAEELDSPFTDIEEEDIEEENSTSDDKTTSSQ